MCVYLVVACIGGCYNSPDETFVSSSNSAISCSADTILRAIEELTFKSITYKSVWQTYDFNTADKMNCLLVNALVYTGQLKTGQEYDFDFDHQFIETEK